MSLVDALPGELITSILSEYTCSVSDVARFRCASRECNNIGEAVYPHTQRLLRKRKQKRGRSSGEEGEEGVVEGVEGGAEGLFQYQDSLQGGYSCVEAWARHATRSKTSDPVLYQVVSQQILKREFLLRCGGVGGVGGERKMTKEQTTIVNYEPVPGKVMLVQAFAGTGKTTTLHEYARRWPAKQMMYLAYNKVLAEESELRFKDCPNVRVTTIHALALKECERIYGCRFTPLNDLTPKKVRVYQGYQGEEAEGEAEGPSGRRSSEVEREAGQAEEAYTKDDMTAVDKYCSTHTIDFAPHLSDRQQALWALLFANRVPTHDMYLKEFQRHVAQGLTRVASSFEVLLLDEVQDCTDCILDIVLQHEDTTRVFVGDVYQKIYGFRHVKDPFRYVLRRVPSPSLTMRYLSVCFRFGFDLMCATNMFIRRKYNEPVGFSASHARANTFVRTQTGRRISPGMVVLCRFNVNVVRVMFELVRAGQHVCLLGKQMNFDKEIAFAREMQRLDRHGRSDHPKFAAFQSVAALYEHHANEGNNKWKTRARLFFTYRDNLELCWTLSKERTVASPVAAVVCVTTAHQSKGSEYDEVWIHDDFAVTTNNEDNNNTLYVAMTRARRAVYLHPKFVTFVQTHTPAIRYRKEVKSLARRKTCTVCRRRQTNLSALTEADPISVIEGGACAVYAYDPTCSRCLAEA